MTTLSNEIQKAIKEQLPNMVATELQEFIAQADKDREARKAAENKVLDLSATIFENAKTIKALEELKNTAEKNKLDREAIEAKQRELKVTLAESATVAAQDKCAAVIDLVGKVFRNAEVRKTIHDVQPIVQTYSGGGQSINAYETKHSVTEEQM